MSDPAEGAVNRPYLESLARRMPGFRGYFEKEDRRASDRLVRDQMADRLQQSKRALDDVARALVDSGQLKPLPEIDRFRARLDKFIGRIRGAMQGYSGFFDPVQVDEARLTEVYEQDMDLVQRVEALQEAILQLPGQLDQLSARLRDLSGEVDKLDVKWNERDEMLKGAKDPWSPLGS